MEFSNVKMLVWRLLLFSFLDLNPNTCHKGTLAEADCHGFICWLEFSVMHLPWTWLIVESKVNTVKNFNLWACSPRMKGIHECFVGGVNDLNYWNLVLKSSLIIHLVHIQIKKGNNSHGSLINILALDYYLDGLSLSWIVKNICNIIKP